ERGLAAAERQREPVVIQPAVKRVDAQRVRGADRVVYADPLLHLHGGDVVRVGQRTADALRAVEDAVHILRNVWLVAADVERRAHVERHGGGRVALHEGGEIGERLEGRTGLAQRLSDVEAAVDALVVVVAAAQHGEHFAGLRVHHDYGGVRGVVVPPGEASGQRGQELRRPALGAVRGGDDRPGGLPGAPRELRARRALDLQVQVVIKGGVDDQPAPVHEVLAEQLLKLLAGGDGKMRSQQV